MPGWWVEVHSVHGLQMLDGDFGWLYFWQGACLLNVLFIFNCQAQDSFTKWIIAYLVASVTWELSTDLRNFNQLFYEENKMAAVTAIQNLKKKKNCNKIVIVKSTELNLKNIDLHCYEFISFVSRFCWALFPFGIFSWKLKLLDLYSYSVVTSVPKYMNPLRLL